MADITAGTQSIGSSAMLLPPEILTRIAQFVDRESLIEASMVCKIWLSCFRPMLWHTIQADGYISKSFLDQFPDYYHRICDLTLSLPCSTEETADLLGFPFDSNGEPKLKKGMLTKTLLDCCRLERIRIKYGREMASISLGSTASFKNTSSLDHSHEYYASAALKIMESNRETLRRLWLTGVGLDIDPLVQKSIRDMPVLEELTMEEWSAMNGEGLRTMLKSLPRLQKLSLEMNEFMDPIWELRQWRINWDASQADFHNDWKSDDEDRSQRPSEDPLTQIRSLHLDRSNITMRTLLDLTAVMPELTELSLGYTYGIGLDDEEPDSDFFDPLGAAFESQMDDVGDSIEQEEEAEDEDEEENGDDQVDVGMDAMTTESPDIGNNITSNHNTNSNTSIMETNNATATATIVQPHPTDYGPGHCPLTLSITALSNMQTPCTVTESSSSNASTCQPEKTLQHYDVHRDDGEEENNNNDMIRDKGISKGEDEDRGTSEDEREGRGPSEHEDEDEIDEDEIDEDGYYDDEYDAFYGSEGEFYWEDWGHEGLGSYAGDSEDFDSWYDNQLELQGQMSYASLRNIDIGSISHASPQLYRNMRQLHVHCPMIQSFDFSGCRPEGIDQKFLEFVCELWGPYGHANDAAKPGRLQSSRLHSDKQKQTLARSLGLKSLIAADLYAVTPQFFHKLNHHCGDTLTALDLSLSSDLNITDRRGAYAREVEKSIYYDALLNMLSTCPNLEKVQVEAYPVNARSIAEQCRPWACAFRLRTLAITIEFDATHKKSGPSPEAEEEEDRQIQIKTCRQLSYLTRLESLLLHGGRQMVHYQSRWGSMGSHHLRLGNRYEKSTRRYIELSISTGLNQLSSLNSLVELNIGLLGPHGLRNEAEVKWLGRNWPSLKRVSGFYDLEQLKAGAVQLREQLGPPAHTMPSSTSPERGAKKKVEMQQRKGIVLPETMDLDRDPVALKLRQLRNHYLQLDENIVDKILRTEGLETVICLRKDGAHMAQKPGGGKMTEKEKESQRFDFMVTYIDRGFPLGWD